MKEKFISKIKTISWRKVLAFILFGVILWNVFLKVTYLFRNTGYDRTHITGIKQADNIDVVFIGGSCTFVYWEVPYAYDQYGITSYDYATNSMRPDVMKGLVQEALKYQDPDLFVISMRTPGVSWDNRAYENDAAETRNATDSMDYSLNRFLTIKNALDHHSGTSAKVQIGFYFDIAKFHSDTSKLGSETSWKQSDNDMASKYNGWEFIYAHESLSIPQNYETTERTPLTEDCEAVLVDLLEYCKRQNLKVLFVNSPNYATADAQKIYNYIGDLIESYGYTFLNGNNYYEEMGLDFSTDFYNVQHVNTYGAEKYTRFLADYILDNFDLVDHRGEDGYEEWDTMYDAFAAENKIVKSSIDDLIEAKDTAYEQGKLLPNITDPYEWLEKIQNNNYFILLESSDTVWPDAKDNDFVLTQFGLTRDNVSDAIRVYKGTSQVYAVDGIQDQDYQGSFNTHTDYNDAYIINCGSKGTICINDTEYAMSGDGIHVVIYDGNYREVLDSVTISEDSQGGLVLKRD